MHTVLAFVLLHALSMPALLISRFLEKIPLLISRFLAFSLSDFPPLLNLMSTSQVFSPFPGLSSKFVIRPNWIACRFQHKRENHIRKLRQILLPPQSFQKRGGYFVASQLVSAERIV